jgi:hypothetical protein
MGRFERTTELDQDGVFAIGHTVTDTETGHQEHFGVDGLTPLGRSISDGDGHMTHISSDGYTCLGHTHTDDDGDSTHTDEDDLIAVGHTDHEPDRDVHTDVDGISSRGSSVPGGSSGFQHFYGSGPDDESEDREPRSGSGASSSRDSGQSSGDGYDSDDDYDSDYETSGSALQQATSRTVPRGVETRWETWYDCYGYPIAVEVWYELQRDERGNSVYAPRLVDPDKACRQTEENAAQRDSEESAFEEPFEGATRCRSQPCNGDAWGWALCAVLGVAIVAGTTLALVFGLRNRNEASDTYVSPQASPSQISEYAKDLKLLLLQERLFCRPDGVQGPETDLCDMTEESLSDKIVNSPPELDNNTIDTFGIRLLLKDERIICGIDRIQTIRTGVRTTDGCIQAEQELDDKLGEIHTDFNDMDNLDRALLLASELHSCRPGMPRSKECIQIGQILGEESGASVAVESNPQYVAPQPSVPEPRPVYTPPRRAHRARPEEVHPRPINPPRNPVETERERVTRVLRGWNPGLSDAELRARAGALGSLFEDGQNSRPSARGPAHVPPVPPFPPPVPYDTPRWRPRAEPKREQYAPQPRQDWQRQRR